MIKELIASFRAIVAFTLLTGIVYPLAITGVAQIAFSKQANGSLVYSGGRLAGSSLLAQKFTGPRYFHPRPSAADYATVASGASNQGFTSAKLRDFVTAQRGIWGENAPLGPALRLRQRARSAHLARGGEVAGRERGESPRHRPRESGRPRNPIHRKSATRLPRRAARECFAPESGAGCVTLGS